MFITHLAHVLLIYVLIGVFCFANEDNLIKEIRIDEGGNLTLPCTDKVENEEKEEIADDVVAMPTSDQVYWFHEHRTLDSSVLENNSLFLQQVKREDAGIYKCASTEYDVVLNQIKVIVRTPPPKLVNVTVHASTILALLRWDVEDTGGYPITHFNAQYRLKHSFPDHPPDIWHKVIQGRISPSASQIDVFMLEPNSTYIFEVWASNELGEGEIVQVEATTQHDNQEMGCVCRNKWHNLRCSYTRYLRGLKNGPSRRNGKFKRKKWFLADAMDFLREYVNAAKKNKPKNSTSADADDLSQNYSREFSPVVLDMNSYLETKTQAESELVSPNLENDSVVYVEMQSIESEDSERNKKPKLKRRAETIDESVENKFTLQEEDAVLLFFKSCFGDVRKLSPKRQRAFKSGVMQILNNLMDEQEEEEAGCTISSTLLQQQ